MPVRAERDSPDGPWWPSRGWPSGLWLRASQSRTVPSSPAEASVRPSGLKATPSDGALVAVEGLAELAWLRVSQSRTVPSSPAEASVRPSGLKATP